MDLCASHHSHLIKPSLNQWLRCTKVVLVCMAACWKSVGAPGWLVDEGGGQPTLSLTCGAPHSGVVGS
jgi:hypothetical protein